MIRIPQIIVAWMFNIVSIVFLVIGAVLRLIAEWVHGTPKTESVDEYSQEGEMTAEALAQLIEDNYKDLDDGGASQEDFEAYLDAQEAKDRKVH